MLTYATVLSCWPRTAASTAGSSTTVLVFSMVADLLDHRPPAVDLRRAVKSIRVSRWPHLDGSESQHLRAGGGVGDELLHDLVVRVTEEDRVDAGDLLGDQRDRVLVRQLRAVAGGAAVAAVGGDDHDVGAALAHDRHPLGGGGDHVVEDAACPRRWPCPRWRHPGWSGRGCRPEGRRVVAAEGDLLDHVRQEGRLAGRLVDRVGGERREAELADPQREQRQAVVELVVAQRDGVVLRCTFIASAIGCVSPVAGDRLLLGVVGGQRGALDGVTGVEHQGRLAAALRADLVDQGGQLRDADVVVLAVVVLGVLVVVPVVDVAVGVRGAEDGQVPGLRSGRGGRPGGRAGDQRERSRRRPRRRAPGGARRRRRRS